MLQAVFPKPNHIADSMIIKVGDSYPGAGRPIIPANIMEILSPEASMIKNHGFNRQALDAQHAAQTYERLFRDNLLMKGYSHRGMRLKFNARLRLLIITAEQDEMVPKAQSLPAQDLLRHAVSRHVSLSDPEAKHYDLLRPGRSQKQIAQEALTLTA
jgi:hypothetical protein